MKTCGGCSLFRPSPYNPKSGNGGCKVMEDWEAKHKERGTNPTNAALKALHVELGDIYQTASALCHPKQDRKNCKRFINEFGNKNDN